MRTLVISRYQAAATSSSGIGWKMTAAMSRCRPNRSSVNGTATASDVVLSWPMNSLPVGGMITRIACGSTVLRIVSNHDIPSAVEASVCPSGTELMPAG